MRHLVSVSFLVAFIVVLFSPLVASARVNVLVYDSSFHIDAKAVTQAAQHDFDSLYQQSLLFKKIAPKYGLEKIRAAKNVTWDFYFLLGMVLFLGVIRLVNPKYLQELWQIYFSVGMNARAVKDKIESATLSNLLMNFFFSLSLGTYLFYLIKSFAATNNRVLISPLGLLALVAGVVIIYSVKYLVIRFSGWAFDIENLMEHYLFNVFLVNKLLAIGLLPFIVILAFPNPAWTEPAILLSLIVAISAFVTRYVRSWKVLQSFFQFSKFHFFTYLCASEILPLAVLMKFLFSKIVM